MKFSFGSSKSKAKHTILFVCIQNAARSQMAEGFFRKYAPEGYEPSSAGTRPTSEVNPLAIEVMKEVGIGISKQRPKDITEDMMRNSAIPTIIGVEVAASAMLMTVIFVAVYTKGLKGFSGIAIGGMVGLDIFFLAFISGASMNPARSLAPALVSGVLNNLWLYWSATFIGTSAVALIFRILFISKKIIARLYFIQTR